jgi:hypothetical protein
MSNDQEFDNTGKGALFANAKKTTERHPDYTGKINVGGVDYWLSAWVRDSRVGKMLSLSVGDRVDGLGAASARELDTTPVRPDNAPHDPNPVPPVKSGRINDDGMANDDDVPF